MFTGIVETMSTLVDKKPAGSSLDLWFKSEVTSELKIDQSVAHNGVCLTVVEIADKKYRVTAVEETLQKTNLSDLDIGNVCNVERCLKADGRFDGHIVQGHIDLTASVVAIENREGSWNFTFKLSEEHRAKIVEKGSVCINGVSLTVVEVDSKAFSVSIIPFTYDHTTFHQLKIGDRINVEYDILGKYIAAAIAQQA